MNTQEKVEVVFEKEVEPLRAFDLSYFIYYLKSLYTMLYSEEEFHKLLLEKKIEDILEDKEKVIETSRYIVRKRYGFGRIFQLAWFFRKNLYKDDIFVSKIQKESPLTIWFMGVSTFLAIAFILCGGEIEISVFPPKIKVKMTSLIEAVINIKKVLAGKEQEFEKGKDEHIR